MKSMLGRLLGYHAAFWTYDKWYRRSWLAGPPAVAATALALVMLPGETAPRSAEWAKPTGSGSQTTASLDLAVCKANGPFKERGEACDRLLKAGKLQGTELGDAYFGRGFARFQTHDNTGAEADLTEAIRLNANNAMAFNNRGAARDSLGRMDDALKDFEEAIRLDGRLTLARANRADILRRQGKLADAQAEVKKALDVDRDQGRAKAVQDLILADIKRMEQQAQAGPDLPVCRSETTPAVQRGEACDRLIKKGGLSDVDLASAHFGRARVHDGAGRYQEAIVDFTEAIRLNPAGAMAFNNRGALRLLRGELDEALRDFNEAIRLVPNGAHVLALANKAEVLRLHGKLDDARTEIGRALEVDRNNARAKQVEGLILADIKRLEDQRRTPSQTDGPSVTPGPLPDHQRAKAEEAYLEALRTSAQRHMRDNDPDRAIEALTLVITRTTPTWVDFNERGRAYMMKRQPAQALEDFNRAVSRAGHGPEAHHNRAQAHDQLGNVVKAREDSEAAINEHGGTNPLFFHALARYHMALSNHPQAILTFDRLIQLQARDPSTKPEDKALTSLLRGVINRDHVLAERRRCPTLIPPDPNCMSGARFASALLDFQQALIFRPGYADAHYEQGFILAEIGNVQKAIEEFTSAIRSNPTFSMAYNDRGVQFAKLRQSGNAMRDFEEAIRHDPKNKYAWANRGMLLSNSGRRSDAIRDFRQALEIDPSYESAIRQLQALGVRR